MSVAAESAEPMRESDHRLPYMRIHAHEIGDGPVALFFHGITANGRVFEPIMRRLAGSMRCISFDQRGHGASEAPATGYSAEDYADDIGLIIRVLKTGRAIVIGHSLGARNALLAGVKYGGAVRAVVAIDFTPYIEPEVFDALDSRVAGGDRLFGTLDDVRDYLGQRYPLLPADAIERRTRFGYRAVQGGFRALAEPEAMRATARGLREDLAPVLEQIRVPTLLVRGVDSKLVSPEAWGRTHALRPDLRRVEVPGTDHYVPEEAPAAVAGLILDFARRL